MSGQKSAQNKTKGKANRPGSSIQWNPASFEDVVTVVSTPGSEAYQKALSVVSRLQFLDCPAPKSDPKGAYRVGPKPGSMQIERLNKGTGTWVRVPLAPTPTAE